MNEAETGAELIDTGSQHFAAFRSLARMDDVSKDGEGKVPSEWAPDEIPGRDRLPTHKLTRRALLALAADSSASIDVLCWSILAWGGMRDANRDRLRSVTARSWLELAEAIRCGGHDRQSAYQAFAELRADRKDKPLKGMRSAYFSKLIFFLMPRGADRHPPGYIMDQWAGCSINLLANRQVVLMDCSGGWITMENGPARKWDHHVSDANDAARYEDFCACVEAVAHEIGLPPDEAEHLMLSGKRRQTDTWRHYVTKHHRPPEMFGAAA